MKYTIKRLPKSQVEVLFEVSPQDLEKFQKEAVSELGKNVKMEGFRPGHVPAEIIEKKIDPMVILKEASEHAIKEYYREALESEKMTPISQPQVDILKLAPGNPFEFKVLVSMLPEVLLPDYKKVAKAIKRNEISVADKEVEDSLLWLRKSRARFSLKNAPSQRGDFVDIEYSSPTLEGGRKYQDAFILGEGKFLEGFEKNLENMKDGEEKKFSVQFPKDFAQKDLAAKDVEFDVKMKSVQKMELPEMSDELARGLGNFENAGALKNNVKDGLVLEKEKAESDRVKNEILEKISDRVILDIPDVLVEIEEKRILLDLKERVESGLRISFDDYLKKIGKSEREILDSFREQAQKRVKFSLVLAEMAKREKIEATEKEIKEEMEDFLKRYPDVKLARSQFDPERLREYTKEAIVNAKTFSFLESLIGS